MGIPFDKNDTEGGFDMPDLGIPVCITIGQCDETRSNAGNSMIVLNCEVDQGQQGAGFKTKFYLVQGRMFNYNCKRIMESCDMDIDAVDVIDELSFRDMAAVVTFKEESYQKDGETRKSTKIDQWLPNARQYEAIKSDNAYTPPEKDEIPFDSGPV